MSDKVLQIDVRTALGAFQIAMEQVLDAKGVTGIFGPSGSGKTTLLRLVAGLDRPEEGRIQLGDDTWIDTSSGIDIPAHRRPVGMVFQGGRIFQHLTVQAQLDFAHSRTEPSRASPDLDEVIDALDIAPLLEHRANQLSGGERQRVAIALALLNGPELLLLDEPLSGLDEERKLQILPYLQSLTETFGVPLLYVTHDAREMSRLADRVLIIRNGRTAGYGEAVQMLNTFAFSENASTDAGTFLEGRITSLDSSTMMAGVDVAGSVLTIPGRSDFTIGDRIRLLILARDVAISLNRPEKISIQNILPGRIRGFRETGEQGAVIVDIDIGPATIGAAISSVAKTSLGLWEGQSVFALLKAVQLIL